MKSSVIAALALVLAGAIAFGSLSAPRPARATILMVNSTDDAFDASPGDGICATMAGLRTLRAAVMEANHFPGADTITLSAGTYTLTDTAAGPLQIFGDLSIVGAGALNTIVDGAGGPEAVFRNGGGALKITGLTIRNAANGIIANGQVSVFDSKLMDNGHGVVTTGNSLTIARTTISGNSAPSNGGGGAGIAIGSGIVTVTDSTLSNNAATGSNSGGAVFAGGGKASFVNVTFSGNTAFRGGAISTDNSSAGSLDLVNVTITSSSAQSGAAISHFNTNKPVRFINTIVANSGSGGNCYLEGSTSLTSLGHNLDSGASCGFAGPGDLNNTNPQLASLADNGGPTQTHALLPGSPAIDAASNLGCPFAD